MSTTGVDGGMAQILVQYIKLRGTCKTAEDVNSVDIYKLVYIRQVVLYRTGLSVCRLLNSEYCCRPTIAT